MNHTQAPRPSQHQHQDLVPLLLQAITAKQHNHPPVHARATDWVPWVQQGYEPMTPAQTTVHQTQQQLALPPPAQIQQHTIALGGHSYVMTVQPVYQPSRAQQANPPYLPPTPQQGAIVQTLDFSRTA
jgi:hypothetical protein